MKRIVILLMAFAIAACCIFSINENGYSIDDDLIKQVAARVPNYTSIDKIPENLKNAVIATEDKRFYHHSGIDIIAMARAIYIDVKSGKIEQGGSTITQQLAKNLFLSNERSFERKFKELFYTLKLEDNYSKDQILEMYLNVIYYGSNTYDVENASKKYFNKDVWDLSLNECAMLAGIPQSPNRYNPQIYPDRAKKRQDIVFKAMIKNGFIKKPVKSDYIGSPVYSN